MSMSQVFYNVKGSPQFKQVVFLLQKWICKETTLHFKGIFNVDINIMIKIGTGLSQKWEIKCAVYTNKFTCMQYDIQSHCTLCFIYIPLTKL